MSGSRMSHELLGYGNDESLPSGTTPTLTWMDMFVTEPWFLPRTSKIRSRHSINNLLSKWRLQSEWLEVVTVWVSRSQSSGTWHSILLIHSKVLEEPVTIFKMDAVAYSTKLVSTHHTTWS